jgi:uncharacterized protein (UPF0261 family)
VLPTQLMMIWAYIRARSERIGGMNDIGSVVETVIITAIFAALAIAIGAIIVSKITAKTNSINLN